MSKTSLMFTFVFLLLVIQIYGVASIVSEQSKGLDFCEMDLLNPLHPSFQHQQHIKGNSRDVWLKTLDQVYEGFSEWWLTETHQYNYNDTYPWLLEEEVVQDNNHDWGNWYRKVTTYDDSLRISTYLGQYWASNTWQNSTLDTYQYYPNGLVSAILKQKWLNNTWSNNTNLIYFYNAGNQISSLLYMNWTNNDWVNGTNVEYTYDTDSLLAQTITYIWNGAWTPNIRSTDTYDDEGYIISRLTEAYGPAPVYHNIYLYAFYYDEQNQLTHCLRKLWWTSDNQWHDDYQYFYTYDAAGNQTEYVEQMYVPDWTNQKKVVSNYTLYQVLNSDESLIPKPLQVSLYPNPISDEFNVKITSELAGNGFLELFDIRGKKLSTQPIRNYLNNNQTYKFNISNLPNGIYLLRTRLNNQNVVDRIMKIK